MSCNSLKYYVFSCNVADQSFVLMQGNGCSLTITSDADGDSRFDKDGLMDFAKEMANWLNKKQNL